VPRYLLAYHGGSMPETEAEQAHVMRAWTTWYTELGEAVVDPGNPVGQASTIAADGKVTSGGGANPVSGYTILEADSLDEAVKMAKGCPARSGGVSIEVAETFNVM
jgi:hypothetical protein